MSRSQFAHLSVGDTVYHTFFRESYKVKAIDRERGRVIVKDPSLKGRACIRTYEIRFVEKI